MYYMYLVYVRIYRYNNAKNQGYYCDSTLTRVFSPYFFL